MPLTPADIRKKRFSTVRFRPGYHEDDVDALLDRVEETLSALNSGEFDGPLITAQEIEESRFRGTRLSSGYNEEEVDDFLDEIAAELRSRGLVRKGDVPQAKAPSSGPVTWTGPQPRVTTGPIPVERPAPPPAPPRAGAHARTEPRGSMTPEHIRNKRFATTRLTTGYNEDEVDDFLDAAEATLDALIKRHPEGVLITASEVERVRFSTTRARPGYDPAQVDAFLDELAAEFRLYEGGE
ncbi:DivIVA domain-containing protein [Nocardiopsis composta]|uniref:Cell wall synthesis protein Wag31 n=1 Tax=Nocardiopsis composta TaxID=157465 RepID=A0A7W8QNW8_9ACTN|nr:DivIVA domain-containing protein [Nocardiopsis composta]MBB5433218.1 DivIVA domain-containing protein [Nocardiopsis composta]